VTPLRSGLPRSTAFDLTRYVAFAPPWSARRGGGTGASVEISSERRHARGDASAERSEGFESRRPRRAP
jgi:hypothetical protein